MNQSGASDAHFGTVGNGPSLGVAHLPLLEAIFDGLPECPFFAKDRTLRYVAANPAMARLCGIARAADIIGRTATDIFPPRLAARYESLDAELIATGRAVRDRLEQTIDGVWLLFSRIPVADGDGACVGLIATAQRMRPGDPAHAAYHRLARVADRLERQLDQPVRLAELAAGVDISPSQLARDFRRAFGVTLTGFLHRRRIERATGLLEQGMPVTEVAHACGYADHSAFTRRFRILTGASPSARRRQISARKLTV